MNNEEIIEKEKKCHPHADMPCINAMLDEARADERAKVMADKNAYANKVMIDKARTEEQEKCDQRIREIFAELEKIWYQTSSRGDTVNLKISAKSYQALKAKHGVSDKTPEQGDRVFDKEE